MSNSLRSHGLYSPWNSPGQNTGVSSHYLSCCALLQTVKNPPAIQETQVQSLRLEDPLEKGMATHSSLPAQEIPWTKEPGEATAHEVTKELDMTKQLNNNSNNRRT